VFSELRTIATERAPFILPNWLIARAFLTAERRGGFKIDEVSPVSAATAIRIPVLLIHGDADIETTPAHSKRVLDALAGPKRLILVPGAGHNQSLSTPEVWREIDGWLEDAVRDWHGPSGRT
jgi:pimeloyl-ACP methyl ester carboxylesterase